jgi:3-hydroxyisobutyrate dehydrogenase-like beta-hydroxyacid dehydrogenase
MPPTESKPLPVIGVLYPGDMGSSLGKVLRDGGFRVVATAEGRSPRSARLGREAGLEMLDSVPAVVQAAEVVLVVVPPAAARAVAEHYGSLAHLAPPTAVYVDASPVRPEEKCAIAGLLADTGVGYIDAAIHGVAAQVRTLVTLYFSGPRADELTRLLAGCLRVQCLGERVGQASAFKMMLGGMSKGLIALFLEMALVAHQTDLLDELLDAYRHFYPGVMAVVERILPTYRQHAARRADEMEELECTMRAQGLEPGLVSGARRLIAALAQTGLNGAGSVRDLVQGLPARRLLADHRMPSV